MIRNSSHVMRFSPRSRSTSYSAIMASYSGHSRPAAAKIVFTRSGERAKGRSGPFIEALYRTALEANTTEQRVSHPKEKPAGTERRRFYCSRMWQPAKNPNLHDCAKKKIEISHNRRLRHFTQQHQTSKYLQYTPIGRLK